MILNADIVWFVHQEYILPEFLILVASLRFSYSSLNLNPEGELYEQEVSITIIHSTADFK